MCEFGARGTNPEAPVDFEADFRLFMSGMGGMLRDARRRAGLSQEEAALRAELSVFTFASLERAHPTVGTPPNPTMLTLLKAMRALRVHELPGGPAAVMRSFLEVGPRR